MINRLLTIILIFEGIFFSISCDPGDRFPAQLRVAGVYSGELDDPWTDALHQSLLGSQEKLNLGYSFSAGVSPSRFEAVLRDYISRGYRLFFGDCFYTEEIARRLAREFPQIYFCLGSEYPAQGPNFSVIKAGLQEPAYLCGVMAAEISSSGKVGVVASQEVPSVNRIINAFNSGIRFANPETKVLVRYTGSRSNISHQPAIKAVNSLLEQGVDTIFAERAWAIKACEAPLVPVFSCYQDLNSFAPLVVISGAVWEPNVIIEDVVSRVRADLFLPLDQAALGTMAAGGAYLGPFHNHEDEFPPGLSKKIAKLKDDILFGRDLVIIDERPVLSDLSSPVAH